MPYLNVKVCAPQSDETSARIAAALTELTAGILGKKPELTAVAVEYVAPKQWFIAGRPLSDIALRSFYFDIKVTEGTNTKGEKARYIAEVFSSMEAIIGQLAPESYIVIHEVRADSWGFQGQTQEYRYIRGKTL